MRIRPRTRSNSEQQLVPIRARAQQRARSCRQTNGGRGQEGSSKRSDVVSSRGARGRIRSRLSLTQRPWRLVYPRNPCLCSSSAGDMDGIVARELLGKALQFGCTCAAVAPRISAQQLHRVQAPCEADTSFLWLSTNCVHGGLQEVHNMLPPLPLTQKEQPTHLPAVIFGECKSWNHTPIRCKTEMLLAVGLSRVWIYV